MGVRLVIKGLEDLVEGLRQLPTHLRDEAAVVVEQTTLEVEATIRARYPEVTGNLKRGLRHEIIKSEYGVWGIVKNVAKHAYMYEVGTELRHSDTHPNLGRMPAAKNFIPTAIRERREMRDDLVEIVERAGLTVRGG